MATGPLRASVAVETMERRQAIDPMCAHGHYAVRRPNVRAVEQTTSRRTALSGVVVRLT